MKKLFIAILTAGLFFCATSAMATSFYYEASNVFGVGEITYGVPNFFSAPEFLFTGLSGDVDTNMGGFVPGNYNIDVTLTNFWVDANEDGTDDFTLSGLSLSLGAYDIPVIPLSGSYGALDWTFNPYSSVSLSYDFGDIGNALVNIALAEADSDYSGNANGVMDAFIGWDTFKVELTDTAPVPEPSTFILLGAGIAGLAFYRRKKS